MLLMQRQWESKREWRRERWDQPDIEIKIRKWLLLQPAGRVLSENTSYRGRGIVCVCRSVLASVWVFVYLCVPLISVDRHYSATWGRCQL